MSSAMATVPKSELERRIRLVQGRMRERSPPLDALLVVQVADLYYLSGTIQQAHLLLPAEGEPRLLVRKVLERARSDSALDDVRPLASLKGLRDELESACGAAPWRLGMELDVLPVNLHRAYLDLLGAEAEVLDGSPLILAARAVKSPWEIEQIREAHRIHQRIFDEVPELLGGELTSYALQSILESRARLAGHCGVIRMRGLDVSTSIGIVVSGEEGALPSHSMFPIGGEGPHPSVAHGGSRRPLRDGLPIALDFLASTAGYHADCTRMAVKGELDAETAAIFEGIGRILRRLEGIVRAGAVPSRIYAAALEEAATEGLANGFMGPEKYQVRFVGHGVGLEVNEVPVLAPKFDEPLAAGNTLAVEPKFTHPRLGVIGLENTYLVRETGVENLTPYPEAVIRRR
jgi:Xaa-Pro dipeptidase